MSDPIQQLAEFDYSGIRTSPPPIADIIRRGNRIRRRNTALATIASVAAVAVIATPLALAATGADTPPHQLSTTPANQPQSANQHWATTIPSDFPLGDGMGTKKSPPTVSTELNTAVIPDMTICEKKIWDTEKAPSTPRDVLGASWHDGPSDGTSRTLALYPSEVEASAAFAEMRDHVTTCPQLRPAPERVVQQPVPLESTAGGDDTFAYFDQERDEDGPDGYSTAYVLTRVGNALLIHLTHFGSGAREIAQQTTDELSSEASNVVGAMCVFAADPC